LQTRWDGFTDFILTLRALFGSAQLISISSLSADSRPTDPLSNMDGMGHLRKSSSSNGLDGDHAELASDQATVSIV
jgi:hypothetical protein